MCDMLRNNHHPSRHHRSPMGRKSPHRSWGRLGKLSLRTAAEEHTENSRRARPRDRERPCTTTPGEKLATSDRRTPHKPFGVQAPRHEHTQTHNRKHQAIRAHQDSCNRDDPRVCLRLQTSHSLDSRALRSTVKREQEALIYMSQYA